MFAVFLIVCAGVGYLLGSIPCGFLVAKWHGVDIFSVGSRSPGATNVKRTIGRGAGNLVFALDFLKGLLATAWVHLLPVERAITSATADLAGEGGTRMTADSAVVWLGLTGMAFAVLGHCFSVFLKFRGGKGVATSLGGALALMPWAAVCGVLVWLILFLTTRYVSLASIGLAATLPIVAYFRPGNPVVFGFAIAVAVFVIVLHRANIGRLLLGTEHRFARKTDPASQPPSTSS